MRIKPIFNCILFLLISVFAQQSIAQSATKEYQQIQTLLAQATTTDLIKEALPALDGIQFPYHRRLHQRYRHLRFYVYSTYQVDALSYKNRIIFRSLKLMKDSVSRFVQIDSLALDQLITKWNDFYQAHKNIADFQREITLTEGVALKAGLGMPTHYATKLKEWINSEEGAPFQTLMQSFYVEQQTFGAVGIRQLHRKKIKIPKKLRQLARHIRRRNAVILTSKGSCVVDVMPYF